MSSNEKLFRAIIINDYKSVSKLLNPSFLFGKKLDVNEKDDTGSSPLCLALENGFNEIIKLLVDQGADVNEKSIFGDPIITACGKNGSKEIVQLLIDKGADVNAKSMHGDTPLIIASSNGKKDIAELLIANNADINARNDDGHTALQFAFATSQGIVQLLLKKANDTIASNDHLIEEYWDLWQTTLMEETARLLLSGQQVNNNEMNEYAIKQASKILMEKYYSGPRILDSGLSC